MEHATAIGEDARVCSFLGQAVLEDVLGLRQACKLPDQLGAKQVRRGTFDLMAGFGQSGEHAPSEEASHY